MSAIKKTTVALGAVTCPSGRLVIADTGYLGLWSGAEPPVADEAVLAGIDDPELRASIMASADLAVVGPDAERAARTFDHQQGTWLYDIPGHGVARLTEKFAGHCRAHGLDARLEPAGRRVPHRERAEERVRAGGGEFIMHGVPVVAVGELPTGRELPVTGTLVDYGGRIGPRWETVTIHVAAGPARAAAADGAPGSAGDVRAADAANAEPAADGEPGGSAPIGLVGVDAARLVLADADGLAAWRHDDPIDGLADVAFWGLSREEAAAELGAPLLGTPGEDGVRGWADLPVRDAVERLTALDEWCAVRPDRRLAVDFRPHSHHWEVMARVRASEWEAGPIDVGGARMLCFMTGWGDGFYPVHVDRDSAGRPVAVRIVLGDEDRRRRLELLSARSA